MDRTHTAPFSLLNNRWTQGNAACDFIRLLTDDEDYRKLFAKLSQRLKELSESA